MSFFSSPVVSHPRPAFKGLSSLLLMLSLSGAALSLGSTAHAATTLVSGVNGTFANGGSIKTASSVSADGTKVVFASDASNLVSGDTNGFIDVFVKDLTTGTITRASVTNNGAQANSGSSAPSISADGTKVVFESEASNLVSDDTNGQIDIFVRDLVNNSTTRVSLATNGAEGDSYSQAPVISADGTKVAFQSDASNLASGDTNGGTDVFVRDLVNNTTTRISVATNGTEGNSFSELPSISDDGTKVAFQSNASNLVSDDTNSTLDVYVRDLTSNTTTRASVATNGTPANTTSQSPVISGDGTKVAFESVAANLVEDDFNNRQDIFVRNLVTGTTSRVSLTDEGTDPDNNSFSPSLNTDGTKIAFASAASNLVSDDTNTFRDIFVRDLATGTNTRVSVATDGTQANGNSALPSLSGNGSRVAFVSLANNLVSNDTNNTQDVFAYDLNAAPTAISLSRTQVQEKQGTNAFVAGISATDPDANESFTYSLPTGVDDNAAFAISGNQLRSAQNFDAATKSSYTITIRVTDSAGNTYDQQFIITVLEITKPVVTITAPAANAKLYVQQFVAGVLNGTATDNVGVTAVKVRLSRKRNNVNQYWNGSNFVTTQSTVDANLNGTSWSLSTKVPAQNKLDVGVYDVQVYALDAAGNKSPYADRSFTLLQDLVAPTVAISTPTANALVNINNFGAGTLSGTASDDIAVTNVKIKLQRKRNNVFEYWNGTDFVTTVTLVDATYYSANSTWSYDSPIPANKLDKGGYTLYATAYDAAGNFKTSPSRLFTVVGTASANDAPTTSSAGGS